MRRLLTLAALAVAGAAFAQPTAWIDDCGLEPPGTAPTAPVPRKAFEPTGAAARIPLVQRVLGETPRVGGLPAASRTLRGALSGKTVYLSPGHGFTWTDTLSAWRTQRGNTNGIVEDLVSTETLSQYVVPMLLGAGADVVPVRETDVNPNLVLVDNGGAGYQETGSGFLNSTLQGFSVPAFPMSGTLQPFTTGTNRLMNAAATATASARYTATIPADGYYSVSVSFTSFSARVTDAHYEVRHSGGSAHFRVNQQRHGGTWVLLGKFYFKAGGTAQVVVHNDSAAMPTGNVSLDAVRFGGGMGFIDRGSGVSGRPFFEESARYYAQWAGAPASVWGAGGTAPSADRTNDVGTRSRMAAWVHEPGEDAVYVAWHTNAFNAAAVGTNTYVYGPNPPDGSYQFTGVPGSDRLAQLVHGELVNDIKAAAGWNQPSWRDRGIDSAYFGELNPSSNGETPAILLEVAFHDAAADANHLKEPGFRYLAARAITQGIIRYFAEKDGVTARLPPEPPTHVSAVNQVGGAVALRWRAPGTDTQGVAGEAAQGYRVYGSADGLGWDEGTAVTGTSVALQLPAGAARFFRITATNSGGESFPSATVGARAPQNGLPLVLVVNGYERLEAAIAPTENLASYSLGTVMRVLLWKMNDGAAARPWGEALAANGAGFDTATTDAVEAQEVALSPYAAVAWLTGRGRNGDAQLSTAARARLAEAAGLGAKLLVSGRTAGDAALLTTLGAGPGAGAGGASVTGEGPLNGLSLALDDGTFGSYAAGPSETVTTTAASVSLGTFGAPGLAGTGVARTSAYLSFPFETIRGAADRAEVLRRLLAFVEPAGFDGGLVEVDAGPVVVPDAGTPDAGTPDAGEPDAGDIAPWTPELVAFQGGGCSAAPAGTLLLAGLALLLGRRRRRR